MAIEQVKDETTLETIYQADSAVLFKHSTVCPASATAMREIRRFADDHPDIPVFVVDVRGQRPLSQAIAARLGIKHESPQAIVIRDAAATWHASHYNVTADKVAAAVNAR